MARPRKTASRRSRQRRMMRGAQTRGAQQSPSSTPASNAALGGGPASEAMPATVSGPTRAASSVATSPRPAASVRGARANPRLAVAGPSRLSERAIEEYHYVRRDLRNIGVLLAIMAVVLAAAVIAFNALGVVRA
jgi:hypothetical protein